MMLSFIPTSLYLPFFPTILPTSLSLLLFFPKTKNHKPKTFKTNYQLPTTNNRMSLRVSLSHKWYGEPSPVSLSVIASLPSAGVAITSIYTHIFIFLHFHLFPHSLSFYSFTSPYIFIFTFTFVFIFYQKP
jgi:hypothetical protein